MNPRAIAAAAVALVIAAGASLGAAWKAADWVEARSRAAAEGAAHAAGADWVRVEVDGLVVRLSGEAPDEAARFAALSAVGKVIDPERLVDAVTVRDPAGLPPPKFTIEFLRSDGGISLIGLVPAAMGREEIGARIAGIAGKRPVTNLLETADHPVPDGWKPAVAFALDALSRLPRAKISVEPGVVRIRAVLDAHETKETLERTLREAVPEGVSLTLDLRAPRPVITPFTLRFVVSGGQARLEACAADSDAAQDRILRAAKAGGATPPLDCPVGLGVPSPSWADAAVMGIEAAASLGDAALTLVDADMTLVAGPDVPPGEFDKVAGALSARLPAVFTFRARHRAPADEKAAGGTDQPVFRAELAGDKGTLELHGRLASDRELALVVAMARARYAGTKITAEVRPDGNVPEGWELRVLAGLDALARLHSGELSVTPDEVRVSGTVAHQETIAEVSRLLGGRLGSDGFSLDLRVDPALALAERGPSPEECVRRINAVLAQKKIVFAPGSAEIDASAAETLSEIARIMMECEDVPMEIGGHTDSQGREEMNQALSQARAEAVLSALLARGVLTRNLTAKGYGESQPIADNKTEEGREANRRIEFRLLSATDGAPEAADGEAGAAADAEGQAAAGDRKTAPADATARPGETGTETEEQAE